MRHPSAFAEALSWKGRKKIDERKSFEGKTPFLSARCAFLDNYLFFCVIEFSVKTSTAIKNENPA
jgi:hypothetical protein